MKIPAYKYILAILDFIFLNLSYSVSLLISGYNLGFTNSLPAYLSSPYFVFSVLYSLIVVFIFDAYDLYKLSVVLSRSRQLISLIISFLYSVITLAVLSFYVRSPFVVESRLAVFYFLVIGIISLSIYRVYIFRLLFKHLNIQVLKRKLLIVGVDQRTKNILLQYQYGNIYGLKLFGFVDDRYKVGEKILNQYQVIGHFNDIPTIVKDNNIGEIIVGDLGYDHDRFLNVLDICKKTGVDLRVTSNIYGIVHEKVSSDGYFNIPSAALNYYSNKKFVFIIKRIIDIIGVSVGIILFSLPMLFIAVLIKLTSSGPILFKQKRIGKNGKEFVFYKFRSMKFGSENDSNREEKIRDFIKDGNFPADSNRSSKIVDESQITAVGKILRKTSLDELPQLFNVLKGDMSLVGPRPCLPYEFDAYDDWHKRRFEITPGCTGLWQVSNRSEGGFNDMVMLDLYYIDNVSPWFDLQIILKTIPVMIFGRGAK